SFADHSRRLNERVRQEALEVAKSLNDIGVTPVFMKGGAHLLSGLYRDMAQRQMADLDILVPADRIDDSVTALAARGITPFNDYEHPRSHHHRPLGRADLPVPIELHREVLAFPYGRILTADEMLTSAMPLEVEETRVAVPSPTCAMIHSIAHAQRGDHACLFGRIDLRGLLDIALIAEAHGDALDWHRIDHCLMRKGGRTAVKFGLRCARQLLGADVPETASTGAVSWLLYRRALYQAENPKFLSLSVRLLQPWTLLVRELSDSTLRRRLVRNMIDPDWWKRHVAMLAGR
ncbi:MAG: nucleotidyltransferase family protein, partial [Desulfobacterales bacterium]|nr:nucleotidyltransferase family protein [Desulfobacterales bacterium]